MKLRALAVCIGAGAILLLAACTSDDDATTTVEPTATEAETPTSTPTDEPSGYSEDDAEYKLAVIDAGGFVATDDSSIDQYAALLDSLDAKCEEDRTLIGDQGVRATQLLADEGISVSILEALEGINGSIPDGSPTMSCAEVGAAWIVLVVANS